MQKSSLTHNFAWMLAGQGLGYGLRVVYFIAIARLLGVLQYGIVVGAFALVNIAAQYGRLGTSTVLLRYVSSDNKRFSVYWGNLLAITFTAGALVVLLIRLIAPYILDSSSVGIVVLLAIGSCFCEQLTIGSTQAFQAFERMRITAILNQLTSLLRTIAASAMLLTLHHATALQWSIASLIASATATVAGVSAVTIYLDRPRFALRTLLQHGGEGIEYAFANSTANAYDDLDKTMLSHYGMSAANGIYGMAYRVIEMATVPITSIQLAAEPRLYQLASSGISNSIALGRRLLKHGIAVSAVSALCLFLLAPTIPLLVGKGFIEGVSALRWLSLIPVFRSVHKISGSVLTCSGMQRHRTITQIIAVILNFALNLWLIPAFGWRGAAWASLATDGTLAILNWSVVEVTSRRLSVTEATTSQPAIVAGDVQI